MAAGARTAYSDTDDKHLIIYLAKAKAEDGMRSGNKLYKTLVEDAEDKWPWSKQHTWQSWRERYRNNQREFDARIKKFQEKKNIDTPKPSSPKGPSGSRNAFTKAEEEHLVKYLAKENPRVEGRNGNGVYKRLVADEEGKWPWHYRHSWQSWRNRYVENQTYFNTRIERYQKQTGLSTENLELVRGTKKKTGDKKRKRARASDGGNNKKRARSFKEPEDSNDEEDEEEEDKSEGSSGGAHLASRNEKWRLMRKQNEEDEEEAIPPPQAMRLKRLADKVEASEQEDMETKEKGEGEVTSPLRMTRSKRVAENVKASKQGGTLTKEGIQEEAIPPPRAIRSKTLAEKVESSEQENTETEEEDEDEDEPRGPIGTDDYRGEVFREEDEDEDEEGSVAKEEEGAGKIPVSDEEAEQETEAEVAAMLTENEDQLDELDETQTQSRTSVTPRPEPQEDQLRCPDNDQLLYSDTTMVPPPGLDANEQTPEVPGTYEDRNMTPVPESPLFTQVEIKEEDQSIHVAPGQPPPWLEGELAHLAFCAVVSLPVPVSPSPPPTKAASSRTVAAPTNPADSLLPPAIPSRPTQLAQKKRKRSELHDPFEFSSSSGSTPPKVQEEQRQLPRASNRRQAPVIVEGPFRNTFKGMRSRPVRASDSDTEGEQEQRVPTWPPARKKKVTEIRKGMPMDKNGMLPVAVDAGESRTNGALVDATTRRSVVNGKGTDPNGPAVPTAEKRKENSVDIPNRRNTEPTPHSPLQPTAERPESSGRNALSRPRSSGVYANAVASSSKRRLPSSTHVNDVGSSSIPLPRVGLGTAGVDPRSQLIVLNIPAQAARPKSHGVDTVSGQRHPGMSEPSSTMRGDSVCLASQKALSGAGIPFLTNQSSDVAGKQLQSVAPNPQDGKTALQSSIPSTVPRILAADNHGSEPARMTHSMETLDLNPPSETAPPAALQGLECASSIPTAPCDIPLPDDPFVVERIDWTTKKNKKAAASPDRRDSGYFSAEIPEKPPRRIDLRQEMVSRRQRKSLSGHVQMESVSSTLPPRSNDERCSSLIHDMPFEEQEMLLASAIQKFSEKWGFTEQVIRNVFEHTRSLAKTESIIEQMKLRAEEAAYALLEAMNSGEESDHAGEHHLQQPISRGGSVNSNRRSVSRTTRQRSRHSSGLLIQSIVDDDQLSEYTPPNSSRAGRYSRLVQQGREEEALQREARLASVHISRSKRDSGLQESPVLHQESQEALLVQPVRPEVNTLPAKSFTESVSSSAANGAHQPEKGSQLEEEHKRLFSSASRANAETLRAISETVDREALIGWWVSHLHDNMTRA